MQLHLSSKKLTIHLSSKQLPIDLFHRLRIGRIDRLEKLSESYDPISHFSNNAAA